jgi:hypothetical protein
MECTPNLLLHVGHAGNALEVALTVVGFVLTLLGLGVAVVALCPRPRPGDKTERAGRAVRRRALRDAETLLDEDVDGGA